MSDGATGKRSSDTPVAIANGDGSGDVVVVCEHASNAIPLEYGDLGLGAAALRSHIAWDPGALPVARALAGRFDAPLVAAPFSRLLFDCNRPPQARSAVPAVSEAYRIPGNEGLSRAERADRVARFHDPFRAALRGCLDRRIAAGRPPVLVTVHTFAPVYLGRRRDTGIGIVHDRDSRLADALIAAMSGDRFLPVRRNDPYGPEDGVTHTLKTHALPRGLVNVMLEIRNDLVAAPDDRAAIAGWLATRLETAVTAVRPKSLKAG